MAAEKSIRNLVWRAMLDSDFNSRYWRAITEKYADRDFWLKLFLALTTSGTVAGWAIWNDAEFFWKILSSISAVVSIASPLLAFSKKAEISAGHAGLWAELRVRFSDLWEKCEGGENVPGIAEEFESLRKKFLELEKMEPNLKIPTDEAIAEKCQADVIKSKNLA